MPGPGSRFLRAAAAVQAEFPDSPGAGHVICALHARLAGVHVRYGEGRGGARE